MPQKTPSYGWRELHLANSTTGLTPLADPGSVLDSVSDSSTGIEAVLLAASAASTYPWLGAIYSFALYDPLGQRVDFSKNISSAVNIKIVTETAPGSSSDYWIQAGISDDPDASSANAGALSGFHFTGGATQIISTRIDPDLVQQSSALSVSSALLFQGSVQAPTTTADASRLNRQMVQSIGASGISDASENVNLGYATNFNSDMTGLGYLHLSFGRSTNGGSSATGKFRIYYNVSPILSNVGG